MLAIRLIHSHAISLSILSDIFALISIKPIGDFVPILYVSSASVSEA